MSGTVHVFDFVAQPNTFDLGSICPLFGGERFLQQLGLETIKSLAGDEAEFSITVFDGNNCDWPEVQDSLATRSLFSSDDEQWVIVDSADSFVKQHRDKLERRMENDSPGCLILVVESWATNTKLYKKIDKSGLQIHCDAPVIKRGRGKQRDDAKILKWIVQRAQNNFGFKLSESGAAVLIELTETNFGLMEQELAKISLYSTDQEALSPLEIRKIVGGWTNQTMWTAVDAALDGRAGHALDMLNKLFIAGEHPLAMFGQISWSLRRYAEVGELVTRDSRARRRINLNESLKTAGFRPWGNELDGASKRLKQLGRKRVARLLDQIVAADYALKRTHSREERGRLVLELLFTSMAEELATKN